MDKSILSEKIRELADASGIDTLGLAGAAEFTGYALTQSKRRDPKLSMPDAETIIVAGVYIGGLTLPHGQIPYTDERAVCICPVIFQM